MENSGIKIEKRRNFLSAEFVVLDWNSLESYYNDLLSRNIADVASLEKLILDMSELEAVISEDAGWRYIRMTCDTSNEKFAADYTFFTNEIAPKIAPIVNQLHKKITGSSFVSALNEQQYFIYLRSIRNALELFREENIPLQIEIKNLEQQYGSVAGAQTIVHEGKEITLPQASVFLKSQERPLREEVYRKVQERRTQDENALNDLFSKLIALRHQVALNAGFKNFRDYMHRELGRFDYSVQDCLAFHDAVKKHIVPVARQLELERKEKLGISDYRPWDTEVDEEGREPLRPVTDADDLTLKTEQCFKSLSPFFGECIAFMKKIGHLDLDSRKGKAPGGYNYPLYETGIPFIFMNSAGLHRDMVTMVHEGGHALHSILTRDLTLTENKNVPSEVAELASMGMELLSMEKWDAFFKSPTELRRARQEQLQKIIKTLPWIASVDKFQHWIYLNPNHSVEERYACWESIMKEFGTGVVNYEGIENNLRRSWQVQLHLFEVPFYYIEYGFAQLGAIALWRNFKQDSEKALNNYVDFLKLGYTKSIPAIYEAAGIKFDFSDVYISELSEFTLAQYRNA
jgi:oligoendopeptidase F